MLNRERTLPELRIPQLAPFTQLISGRLFQATFWLISSVDITLDYQIGREAGGLWNTGLLKQQKNTKSLLPLGSQNNC